MFPSHDHVILKVPVADITPIAAGGSEADMDNFSAMVVTTANATFATTTNGIVQEANATAARRLTRYVDSDKTHVYFTFVGTTGSSDQIRINGLGGTDGAFADTNGVLQVPIKDNLVDSTALGSIIGSADWGLEGSANIPEIDIKVDSIAVTAQTKKLKAKWTPELGQDLNAYHNLDAEVELTGILSEQIAPSIVTGKQR